MGRFFKGKRGATRYLSISLAPINETEISSSLLRRSAIAKAGKMCPPVPPAAITIFFIEIFSPDKS
jgi:hypothetical protein